MQMMTLTVYFENGGKPFSESVDLPMGAVPAGMDLQHYASHDPQFRRLLSVEPERITAVRLTGRFDTRWPSIPLPL